MPHDPATLPFVILRLSITQGYPDPGGQVVARFGALDEAQAALATGRAAGDYARTGHMWSGATDYEVFVWRDGRYELPEGGVPPGW